MLTINKTAISLVTHVSPLWNIVLISVPTVNMVRISVQMCYRAMVAASPAPRFSSAPSKGKSRSLSTNVDSLLDDMDTAAAESRSARVRHKSSDHAVQCLEERENADKAISKGSLEADSHQDQASLFCQPAPVMLMPARVPALEEKAAKMPSELAIQFLKWVQQQLASGSVKHNEAGAPVHFIEHGTALVSTLIFRLYAEANDESSDAPEVGED